LTKFLIQLILNLQLGELLKPKNLAKKIAKISYEKKAENIVIMNLKPLTTICDYFLICTAQSDTHAKAITDELIGKIETRPWHIEGYEGLKWVLIDYVDVVAHIFLKEIREYYNLERLWGDAKIENYPDSEQ